MLTIVEKVLFLQEVDIFENTLTEDLAHIAAITEEIQFKAETDIYQINEISDSMYVIVEGKVRLHVENKEVMVAGSRDAFGTWALMDDELRVSSATALEPSRLLRIDREEFFDLLSDHSEITQGILKTLSKRLRKLIQQVQIGSIPKR